MTTEPKTAKAMTSTPTAQAARKSAFSFVTDTWAEFKKVVWPTRQETVRLTVIVIIITASLGLILGGIDLGFTRLIGIIGGTS
jgi:preprotein translocase subunit SecE